MEMLKEKNNSLETEVYELKGEIAMMSIKLEQVQSNEAKLSGLIKQECKDRANVDQIITNIKGYMRRTPRPRRSLITWSRPKKGQSRCLDSLLAQRTPRAICHSPADLLPRRGGVRAQDRSLLQFSEFKLGQVKQPRRNVENRIVRKLKDRALLLRGQINPMPLKILLRLMHVFYSPPGSDKKPINFKNFASFISAENC